MKKWCPMFLDKQKDSMTRTQGIKEFHLKKLYTVSLAPADFRSTFTHVFLVTNDLSAADLTPVDFCLT